MVRTLIDMLPFIAPAVIIVWAAAIAQGREAKREKEEAEARAERLATKQERDRERRSELLARLSMAYKKARKEGRRDIYVLAASHCCQLLSAGEDVNEGAALVALRGLEGDRSLDAAISARLELRRQAAKEEN